MSSRLRGSNNQIQEIQVSGVRWQGTAFARSKAAGMPLTEKEQIVFRCFPLFAILTMSIVTSIWLYGFLHQLLGL